MEDEGLVELLPPVEVRPQVPSARDLDRAVEALLAARRPLIYAGGGVHLSGAHEALGQLAEHLQAGVAQSAEGKGAVSDHNSLSLGAALWRDSALRAHIQDADVVLAVGSRLALVTFKPGTRIVQIDADEQEIGRNHKDTLGLVGDARATLEALLERLRAATAPRPSRKAEHEAVRARVAAENTMEPNASIIKSLRAGAPENTILIAGMTQIGYYSRPFWPVYEPRTYLSSSYSGNLGYAYPVALGAKVARPDRPVVSVSGDGGFLFNAQELSTAARHRINVVAVVFNDDSYGNVARDLDESWGGQYGAELRNPDFMKLADAYGVVGMRAKEPTEVGRLVREAIEMDRPALVEVPVGRMNRPAFFGAPRRPVKVPR
jgi:acetolactate synthase-1/2/3 large subunit